MGTILGSVTDATGAAVGDVSVTVKNQATNLTVNATSQGNGLYQVPNLPIGAYTVTFSKAGFQGQVHSQILVRAERATTVNGSLAAGAVNTTVEVTATPLLNETDPTNGYVLDAAAVQNIPLGTGSFTQLALLSPGVNADFLAGNKLQHRHGQPADLG